MNELEYISDYFSKKLSAEEIVRFDERIQRDPVFAEEVAFYYSTITEVKSRIAAEKKHRFKELYKQQNKEVKIRPLRRWWPYMAAAAAIVAIVIGIYLSGSKNSASQLADNYIKDKLGVMRVTMGVGDSLQKGRDLYNHKEYASALKLFAGVLKADSTNNEAKKSAGIVSLQLQQYDKALEYFTALEQDNLEFNPGKFYHALTLIKRNQPGDTTAAKKLLQEVVQNDLEGKETAEDWLKKL